MLYALLCYDSEDVIGAWSAEHERAVMARLGLVERSLAGEGRLAGAARLLPSTTAVTLCKARENLVIDGPFAETKEQLLGFFLVECEGLEAAIEVARRLAVANPGRGAYEIRPVEAFKPGALARAVGSDAA